MATQEFAGFVLNLLSNPTNSAVAALKCRVAVDAASRTVSESDRKCFQLYRDWHPKQQQAIDACCSVREAERLARLRALNDYLDTLNLKTIDLAVNAVESWHQANPYELTGVDLEAVELVSAEIEQLKGWQTTAWERLKRCRARFETEDFFDGQEWDAAELDCQKLEMALRPMAMQLWALKLGINWR